MHTLLPVIEAHVLKCFCGYHSSMCAGRMLTVFRPVEGELTYFLDSKRMTREAVLKAFEQEAALRFP